MRTALVGRWVTSSVAAIGCQYRRSSSPILVQGPTLVKSSLSSGVIMCAPCIFSNVAPRRSRYSTPGRPSPPYWIIGEALQKPPKCSLCLERGKLGIAIFSGFKNVLSSFKVCDTFAFFRHCKQKSLSLRKFLKLLKRLLAH